MNGDTVDCMSSTAAKPSRPVARALQIAAVTWFVAALTSLVIGVLHRQAFERVEAGASFETVDDYVTTLSWISSSVAWLSALVVVLVAGAWARVPGRIAIVVRTGQGALALATVLHLTFVLVRFGARGTDDFETMLLVQRCIAVGHHVGLVGLLVGSRTPIQMRVGYVGMTLAWIALIFMDTSDFDPGVAELFDYVPLAMAATWSAGLWLAAPAYADVEATVAAAPRGVPVDDPTRLRAAGGLSLLRGALIVRIAVSIGSVALLVWLRDSPGSASLVVWLLALVQCGIAIAIGSALTSYSSLPDVAIERGHVNTVIACVTIGAVLELAGASMTSDLLGVAASAKDALSFYDMPRISDLEALQSRALWAGRLSGVVGIVAGVSLSLSLRQTALWLDDAPSVGRASTLAVATILAGGGATVLIGLAQSGAVKEVAVLVSIALAALVLAIVILTTWLRLLGAIAQRLGSDPGRG